MSAVDNMMEKPSNCKWDEKGKEKSNNLKEVGWNRKPNEDEVRWTERMGEE